MEGNRLFPPAFSIRDSLLLYVLACYIDFEDDSPSEIPLSVVFEGNILSSVQIWFPGSKPLCCAVVHVLIKAFEWYVMYRFRMRQEAFGALEVCGLTVAKHVERVFIDIDVQKHTLGHVQK